MDGRETQPSHLTEAKKAFSWVVPRGKYKFQNQEPENRPSLGACFCLPAMSENLRDECAEEGSLNHIEAKKTWHWFLYVAFVNQFNYVTFPPQMCDNKVRVPQQRQQKKPQCITIWLFPTQSVFPLELTMNHLLASVGPSRGRHNMWINVPGGAATLLECSGPGTSCGGQTWLRLLSLCCMELNNHVSKSYSSCLATLNCTICWQGLIPVAKYNYRYQCFQSLHGRDPTQLKIVKKADSKPVTEILLNRPSQGKSW